MPLGYGDPVLFKAGTPYGASAVVNNRDITAASEDELEVARFQGKRVAQVARALAVARQNETNT